MVDTDKLSELLDIRLVRQEQKLYKQRSSTFIVGIIVGLILSYTNFVGIILGFGTGLIISSHGANLQSVYQNPIFVTYLWQPVKKYFSDNFSDVQSTLQ